MNHLYRDGTGIHACEGSEIHPGIYLVWTLCNRDVPANESFKSRESVTCEKCIAALSNNPPVTELAEQADTSLSRSSAGIIKDGTGEQGRSGEAVAWMYEFDGMVDGPVLSSKRWTNSAEPWTETPLYTSPPAASSMVMADRIIAAYKEHYSFPPQGESHMHDCIVDVLSAAKPEA